MMTLPALPVSFDLEDFSCKCLRHVSDHLYKMTRFGTNIQISDVRTHPEMCCFTIMAQHPLEIIPAEETMKGRASRDPRDVVAQDESVYRMEIQKRVDSEFRNRATLDQLWRTIIESKYPALSNHTRIRSHPQRIHFNYDCPKCDATGKVECSGCSGDGWSSCLRCTNGMISARVGKRTYYKACPSCGGRGTNRCWSCSGRGITTCGKCDGLKLLTNVSSIHSHTAPQFSATYGEDLPEFVRPFMEKAGLSNMGNLGSVHLIKSEIDTEVPSVLVQYAANIPFCQVQMCVQNIPARWILAGKEPAIYYSDGVVERLLTKDLELLSFDKRFFATRRQLAALTQFTESGINQIIFEETARNRTPEQIVQIVTGAVSANYVNQALKASGKMLAPILHCLRLGVFAIPVSTFFAVEVFHASVNLTINTGSRWEAIFCLCLMGLSLLVGLGSGIVAHFQVNGWIISIGGISLLKWAEKRRWVFGPVSIMLVVFFSAHFPLVHFERNIVGEITWESEFTWLQEQQNN